MHVYGITINSSTDLYRGKNDIRTFAQQHGFARIMCRCPVGQTSMRKKVDELLTSLEEMYPNVREKYRESRIAVWVG